MPVKKTAPTKKQAVSRKHPRKDVEIDEARQRAGDDSEIAFKLQTPEGPDALAEELGEEFVENVTGANDAASEHRDQELLDEQGSFVVTSAETEFANGVDGSNPLDAEPSPLPHV